MYVYTMLELPHYICTHLMLAYIPFPKIMMQPFGAPYSMYQHAGVYAQPPDATVCHFVSYIHDHGSLSILSTKM